MEGKEWEMHAPHEVENGEEGGTSGDGETIGREGGWMEGGRKGRWRGGGGGRGRGGGLDDKRKIQTGQSFLFANRAPDKDSACSGADRGAISLPYSLTQPLLLTPSLPRLTHPAVSLWGGEEERKKEERKKEGPYQCSIMVLPSTSHHAAINIAPITVKGTRLGQDDNEHILSSPAEELKRTHKHTRKHTLGTTCTNVHKTCAAWKGNNAR